MEQKKNKLLSDMIQNDTDKKMVQLVEAATDLSCGEYLHPFRGGAFPPFCGKSGRRRYIHQCAYKRKRVHGHCPVQTSKL